MPNFAAILKTEIARLARRSTRPLYAPIKKDVAVLKRTLAEHKRLLTELAKDNTRLLADLQARIAAPTTASDEETRQARLGPRLIHSQRKRLGLSRAAFAKLLGVSSGAVVAWEGGRSKPRTAAKAAIVAIRAMGRRDARQRLELLSGKNDTRKKPLD